LLQNIVGNFQDGQEEDDAWLDMLTYFEQVLEEKAVVDSDFALIVATPIKLWWSTTRGRGKQTSYFSVAVELGLFILGVGVHTGTIEKDWAKEGHHMLEIVPVDCCLNINPSRYFNNYSPTYFSAHLAVSIVAIGFRIMFLLTTEWKTGMPRWTYFANE
jgi:hypothetical protein